MEQVLFGGYYDALPVGATEYNRVHGGHTWHAQEHFVKQIVTSPGKMKKLRIALTAAPGADESYAFALMVNGSPSSLAVTIEDTDTSGADTSNEVTLSPGDEVSLRCVGSAGAAASYAKWTMVFAGQNVGESLLLGHCGYDEWPSITSINYCHLATPHSTWDVSEANHRQICPTPGKIKNLYITLSGTPGGGGSWRFTVLKNGVATAVTVTITDPNTSGSDTTHEATFARGDRIGFMCEPIDSPSNTTRFAWWGTTFVADTDGESIIIDGCHLTLDGTDTMYRGFTFPQDIRWETVEAEAQVLAQECTLKSLCLQLSGTPGTGNYYYIHLRQNGANSALTVTFTGTDTYKEDLTHEVAISDDDEVNLRADPFSTPFARSARWGMVCSGAVTPPRMAGLNPAMVDILL